MMVGYRQFEFEKYDKSWHHENSFFRIELSDSSFLEDSNFFLTFSEFEMTSYKKK